MKVNVAELTSQMKEVADRLSCNDVTNQLSSIIYNWIVCVEALGEKGSSEYYELVNLINLSSVTSSSYKPLED